MRFKVAGGKIFDQNYFNSVKPLRIVPSYHSHKSEQPRLAMVGWVGVWMCKALFYLLTEKVPKYRMVVLDKICMRGVYYKCKLG